MFFEYPSSSLAGQVPARPFRVVVLDSRGEIVENAAVQVTISITNGSGASGATLHGTTVKTTIAGRVVFDDLTIDRSASDFTLTAVAHGLQAAVSPAFSVTPGPPARLVILAEPTSAVAATRLKPALEVALLDEFGNRTAGGDTVFVAIATGTGASGAKLSGLVARQTNAGIAVFDDLTIDRAASPGARLGGVTQRCMVAVVGRMGIERFEVFFPFLTIDSSGAGYGLTATAPGMRMATSAAFGVTEPPASASNQRTRPPSS